MAKSKKRPASSSRSRSSAAKPIQRSKPSRARAPVKASATDTRGRILSLLAREVSVYNRKTRERESRPVTQREIAAQLGISVRTLQRAKKGETKLAASPRAAKVLARESAKENRSRSSKASADRKKHPTALKLDRRKIPAVPKVTRRKLNKYEFDPKIGRRIETGKRESDWANYDVRGWNFREIAELVFQAWREGHPFQFIYEVPRGGKTLTYDGRETGTIAKKTERTATAPINPGAFDDEAEIVDFLNNYIALELSARARRMLYISVNDRVIEHDNMG